MNKTIILDESSTGSLKAKDLLPKFIYQDVKIHNTSIGDNDALPTTGDYPYDYMLIKARYRGILRRLEEHGMPEYVDMDEETILNTLGKLVAECKKVERPIRPVLEKICYNAVNKMFRIPNGVINMECKLVDKVRPAHPYRVLPEMEENKDDMYQFRDTLEAESAKKTIEKRRIVNALVQGAAAHFAIFDGYVKQEIDAISEDFIPMYEQIMLLNDLLLFRKKEKITDENPMQSSYVEVTLGGAGKRSVIESQAIIFPLLYQETIKGLFELTSAHGLPRNPKRAKYVIRRADFIMAEPWDMRFGKTLWEAVFSDGSDERLYPYIFKHLIQMKTDEFNEAMREMIANTKRGEEIYAALTDKAFEDMDYQKFATQIMKDPDKSLIADSYFTASELDSLTLDGEPEEDDIITEEGDEEMEPTDDEYRMLLANCSWEDINFEEGEANQFVNNMCKLDTYVDGIKIPVDLINAQVSEVAGGKANLHLFLDDSIRGFGVGTKLCRAFIEEFGYLYFGKGRVLNHGGVIGMMYHLAKDDTIETWEDDISYNARLKDV